jgi:sugar/nucleoside kinase (ribokinase family)
VISQRPGVLGRRGDRVVGGGGLANHRPLSLGTNRLDSFVALRSTLLRCNSYRARYLEQVVTRRGILTGGTWCLDRNLMVDVWPEENGRADILESDAAGGGPAYNLAADIRRLDPMMPVAAIGLVGDDADGRLLVRLAASDGIDVSRLRVTSTAATDYSLALCSSATGKRTHICFFGSSHELTPDHFEFSRETHRIFHLGLPGIHRLMDAPWKAHANGWLATLIEARQAGLITNLELPSIEGERLAALARPCLPYLDLLVVNDTEIGGIADVKTIKDGVTDIQACMSGAKAVLTQGAMQVVVVHFPAGAIAVTRDGTTFKHPSVRVPPNAVAGANGAGDAFAAGFLYAMHEEWGLERAIALAHAAAAASLRAMSTSGAVETWAACLALADQWGWRENMG